MLIPPSRPVADPTWTPAAGREYPGARPRRISAGACGAVPAGVCVPAGGARRLRRHESVDYPRPLACADCSADTVGWSSCFAALGLRPGDSGLWRSLVADLTGGQGVADSNPVSPAQ